MCYSTFDVKYLVFYIWYSVFGIQYLVLVATNIQVIVQSRFKHSEYSLLSTFHIEELLL
jgi:hypothetical protein